MEGRRAAAVVFLVALLARAVVLLAFDGGPSRPLEGDERDYAAVAGSLARGDGFGFDVHGFTRGGVLVDKRLVAFRAPLLPLLLAPAHLASDGDPAVLRWMCVLLGAMAAPLAAVCAARLGGWRAAWIAGGLVSLWPSHAWLSARVLSEPLDSVLLLAAADLLLRRRPFAGGAALGLALLCRPGGLLAALLATIAAVSVEERGRRVRTTFAILGAVAVLLAPWALRNRAEFGQPLLATTSGLTLLGGNCDAALEAEHPGKWMPPEVAWRGHGAPDLGPFGWSWLDEAESSARFSEKAREWVAADPLRAAKLAAWKVVRFVDPDTRSGKEDAGRKALLGWLSWGPALLLVAVALARGRQLREPEWRLAIAFLAGHLAVAIVTYGDARMRAPVEPALLALLVAPLLADGVAKWISRRDAVTVAPSP
jgi:hypothetical protein